MSAESLTPQLGTVLEAALIPLSGNVGGTGRVGMINDLLCKAPLTVATPFFWSPRSFIWEISNVAGGQSLSPTQVYQYDGPPVYASLRTDIAVSPNILGLQDQNGNWITSVGPRETFTVLIGDLGIATINCPNGHLMSVDSDQINPGVDPALWWLHANPDPPEPNARFFVAPTAIRQPGGADLKLATKITTSDVQAAIAAVGGTSASVAPMMQIIQEIASTM
jgi:hypothetical protein